MTGLKGTILKAIKSGFEFKLSDMSFCRFVMIQNTLKSKAQSVVKAFIGHQKLFKTVLNLRLSDKNFGRFVMILNGLVRATTNGRSCSPTEPVAQATKFSIGLPDRIRWIRTSWHSGSVKIGNRIQRKKNYKKLL